MRRLLLAGLLLLTPGWTAADGGLCGNQANLDVFDYEAITVSTTAIGFTASKYLPSGAAPAEAAVVTVESQSLRWRADGTDPAATEGHQADAGDSITVCGRTNVAAIKFIRKDGTDSTIRVSYLR